MDELELCRTCVNKTFSPTSGIVCGLTNAKPDYVGTCKDYVRNQIAFEKRAIELKELKEKELISDTGGLNAIGIKNPVIAGLILTVLTFLLNVLLFVYASRISIWLIIIFIFCAVLLVKGIKKWSVKKNSVNVLDDDF